MTIHELGFIIRQLGYIIGQVMPFLVACLELINKCIAGFFMVSRHHLIILILMHAQCLILKYVSVKNARHICCTYPVSLNQVTTININRKYRLLKVCYVPATITTFCFFSFLLQPLTILMRHTRQGVCAINQCIFLRCLWLPHSAKTTLMLHKKSIRQFINAHQNIRRKFASFLQLSKDVLL